MRPRDGFGLHIDFAQRMLENRIDLSPSGLEDHQIRFEVPEDIGVGLVELTQLGAGLSYGSWSCDDARDEVSMRTELPPHHLALPFHLLPELCSGWLLPDCVRIRRWSTRPSASSSV